MEPRSYDKRIILPKGRKAGVAAFLTGKKRVGEGFVLLEVGAKTSGFLQGELLRGAWLAKTALAFEF